MKIKKSLTLAAVTIIALSTVSMHGSAQTEDNPYLGRWALYLPNGAGWLEIRQEQGYLDGDMLWYSGSPVPLGMVTTKGDALVITRNSQRVRERDAERNPLRTQIITTWTECILENGELNCTSWSPGFRGGGGMTATEFTGKKIPDVPPAPDLASLKYGPPITLFNGKDLTGWTLTNPEQTNGWKVIDGTLVNDAVQVEGQRISYGNLMTTQKFEDFSLKIEVNVPEESNSGIYLRGIYEIQVMDSYGLPLDPHNMGALYSRITPSVNAEKPAGQWQTLDITLCKRHVTVILNGTKIIDNQPVYGCTGGALTADEFIPGPIYLQGDHQKASYRNIVLRNIIN